MADTADTLKTAGNEDQEPGAGGPSGGAIDKYRLLHDAVMHSSINYHATIALSAMLMARAQGRIQRGPNVRRQALLAMAQGLFSAGHPHTLSSLQVIFSEMHRAGMFTVERATDSPSGAIVDIDFVLPNRARKQARVKYRMFTLNWSRRTSRDIETFPILAMSVTPQPQEVTSARAAASREREAAHRRERQALAAEAEAAAQTAQAAAAEATAAPATPVPDSPARSELRVVDGQGASPEPPQIRSYWADDRAEGYGAAG